MTQRPTEAARSSTTRPRAARRRPHRGRQGGRRPGRRRVRPARRPAVRRPRADGGRARRGQDAAGAHPGRSRSRRRTRKRVQFTPDLMPGDITGSMVIDGRAGRAHLPRGPAVHATCCWPTRSTGRRPRPSRRCWRRWRRARSRSTASRARCPGRSWWRRPRTRSSTRAPTRCPRPSSTASCSSWCCRCPTADAELEILRRHAAGFDPRDVAAPASTAVAGPADIAAGQAAVRAVQVSPEVTGYIVDIARATRESPSLSLGRLPARGDRAAAHGPRLGLADRSRLRDARRRQGPRPRHARPTGSGCGPRPSSRASTSAPCSPPRSARSRSRAEHDASPGASRSCCSLGLVPVVLRPAVGTVWLWLLLVALVTAVDWLLAPRPATLEVDPPPARRRPAGHAGRLALTVDQPPAARRARRWSATPGSRRAGADRQPAPGPARGPATAPLLDHRPAARAAAATCRAVGVTVRLPGPARARRPPGDPRRARARSARCRPSSRASTCPRGWPGCASSTAARRSGSAARAPSSTRCASTSAATTSAPSTGGPAPATATSSCAPGSPSGTAGWCSCSTPRASRPGGSATCPGSTRRWTRRCCSPRSPPGPATGSTSSPATARSGPGSGRPGPATSRPACRRRWPTSSR